MMIKFYFPFVAYTLQMQSKIALFSTNIFRQIIQLYIFLLLKYSAYPSVRVTSEQIKSACLRQTSIKYMTYVIGETAIATQKPRY